MSARIFLLSPAHCGGERARLVLRPEAEFDLARRLRTRHGASLGEVFSFLSGLYFRGKLAYAERFAVPARPKDGAVYVIAPGAGLQGPGVTVTLRDLQAFAGVVVAADNPRYRGPLLAGARAIARRLSRDGEVVLLGSIASTRYVELLAEAFGDRLRFPAEFVGRGDMSRGGQLLRAARTGVELAYRPIDGAERRGARAIRLDALERIGPARA